MSNAPASPESVRRLLAPFGTLRPQPASDWSGDHELHPALASFYAEVGPWGEDGPGGPDGLTIPTSGNPFWLPPLRRLWDFQAGYRWDSRSGRRAADWRDEWLVIADQEGDPFMLDRTSGAVLHARHGEGAWNPIPLFADTLVMAAALGTVGAVFKEAGNDLYDASYEIRPAWRATLRARLAPLLGEAAGSAAALRLEW